MSSNESSPRLHGLPQPCMDSFYQQPMQTGSIPFDRFSPYNQNTSGTFTNYPHSYGTLVPQRQPVSSNTLPSIGNFSDPLSFMPFSSPHVPVHAIDRRESLPEFSAIDSCAVDNNNPPRSYALQQTQDGKPNMNNAELVPNMFMVPHNVMPQRDKSQKQNHQQSPSIPTSSLPQANSSSTSNQFVLPQHSQPVHSNHMNRYRRDNGNIQNTSIPANQEESAQSVYSTANIPQSLPPPVSAPHFNTGHQHNNKTQKIKPSHEAESRSRSTHSSQSKRRRQNNPTVMFKLVGRLEKGACEPRKETVSVQTDLSMLLNNRDARRKAGMKSGPSHSNKLPLPKIPPIIHKEPESEDDVPESFNVLSAADIDEYQNFETDGTATRKQSVSSEAINQLPTNIDFEIPKIKSESNGWDNENANVQTMMANHVLNKNIPVSLPNFNPRIFQSIPMSAFKGKDKEAEMERMEINVKIDDSQYVSVGDSPKRWQCNLCPKSYTTKHNLVTHVLDHNGIKPHLCMICGKYFKQLSHLNTHMLTHDNVKPHICPVCGKGFTQVSHLKRHQAVHLDNKPHICDICKRGFAYPSELRLHKEKHVAGKDKCLECDEDFGSPKLLKEHQATHENREDHECPECQRLFRYPSQLKDHLKSHSGYRPFICTECGMDFIKEHHLKAHQFTHTGLRPYQCPQCGKCFNQRANMVRHQLIHSNDRAYKCDQCEKTFTQQQTLKAHMVVHADKKPHQCQLCGKEFGRFHNLAAHMHMHSDSKPFLCFCGSSFTLKGNLKRHKKIKHGIVDDSTESMEEEAVSFLSTMSVRASQNTSSPLSADLSQDSHGSNENSQSEDSLLKKQQRKSVPRKIPQSDEESEGEIVENKKQANSRGRRTEYFEDKSSGKLLAMKRSYAEMNEGRGNDINMEGKISKDVDFLDEEVDENELEELEDDELDDDENDDDEWTPEESTKPRVTKGKKLASVLTEKFSRSKASNSEPCSK